MKTTEIKIGPRKDKGDKTLNELHLIREGYNDEIVFMGVFCPDQMARCIEETFAFVSLADVISENDESPSRTKSVATEKTPMEHEGKKKTGSEAGQRRFSGIDSADVLRAFRQAASAYIATNLIQSMEEFYLDFVDEMMKHALNALADDMEKRGLERPSQTDLNSVLNRWMQIKRLRLGLPPQNRPRGREDFRNCEDFKAALKQVLSKLVNKPNRRQLWQRLRQHPLYCGKKKGFPSANEAQTLDNWFEDCGIKNIDEAIEMYWNKPLEEE